MTFSIKELTACRISGSKNLISVLNLGQQALTGVFPKDKQTPVTSGPLELVLCPDSGLLQLKHSYNLDEMYGMNYGYRSGLNPSMVKHLKQKAEYLMQLCPLGSGDTILDIGSNDATLLKAYQIPGLNRIGIDPTGKKFSEYYTEDIELVPDFFSEPVFRNISPSDDAKIITSIAMFYDLESPKQFVADIASILSQQGVWHFEQSYMPSMLRMNAFDTVCHEHLEYYSLSVVKRLLEDCELQIIDVGMNSVNGGSFAVTASRKNTRYTPNHALINWFIAQEDRMGLDTPTPYRHFEERVFHHRKNLQSLLHALNSDGKKIIGYGASTKGNVLLQFCGLTPKEIPFVAEINPNKFGAYTPGTYIPIISETEAKKMKPDYMLVMPWHFRDTIIQREQEYLQKGGKLIFPLPEIEII